MHELESALLRVRSEAKQRLFPRNPKYRYWAPVLEHFGLFLGNENRGKIMEADYLVLRLLDDYADHDTPIPEGYTSPSEFIQEKINYLHTLDTPDDDVERLLLYSEQLSYKEDLSLNYERELIMRSMLFDAQRFGRFQLFPTSVLNEHFYQCDIEGTGKGALKIFGEDPRKYKLVEPLGIASRIHDNLSDYQKDIDAGYINVSQEDVNQFQMTPEDIKDVNSDKVRAWFAKEKRRAWDLLEQDRQLFPQGRFGKRGRVFVDLYFRRPAVRYLNSLK
ncbi:hypothetical protein HYT02_05585 [Candidatus Gottesmanbacteria bacterium]|nr:hypothetical protein [Candidatus Gottesmanbacteria bacterium]